MGSLEQCFQEWEQLSKEFHELEETHKLYCKKVDEVKAIQGKCMSGISHQRYRIKKIQDNATKLSTSADAAEQAKHAEFQEMCTERKTHFREMEEVLPHENGLYLKIILGSVNISLLSKLDKFKYKDNYETFKLYITVISLICAITLWFLPPYRVLDATFQFLLVWYYCTLTIREHILKVNGSRIKGWWITHHFISCFCAAILLIWPDGFTYNEFHRQFVAFSIYVSIVQVAQYYYQKGCLYRLRALGERHNMDLTVEGFGSWMWKGLTFLVPFLIMGYFFQFYNAWVLYRLSQHEKCIEWQVFTLSIVFFLLFMGNTLTTITVFRQKFKRSGWMQQLEYIWKNKYKFPQYIAEHAQNIAEHAQNKMHGE